MISAPLGIIELYIVLRLSAGLRSGALRALGTEGWKSLRTTSLPAISSKRFGHGRALAWRVLNGNGAEASQRRSSQLPVRFASFPSSYLGPPPHPRGSPQAIVTCIGGGENDVISANVQNCYRWLTAFCP